MADEQPPALVVVLPDDVPEAAPPPAVAEENPSDAAVVARHAEVNFSLLICCLFDSAISHVSLVSQVLFWQFFCHGQICDSSVALVLDYRLWPMRFYLTRSLVAECLFPVLLCFIASFLLIGCGRERNNCFFLGCGRIRNSLCRLGPRRK